MNDDLQIRVSFDLEGKLARAFVTEQARILGTTGSASESAKSTIGRKALIEYLNARGYHVEDTTKWGGRQESGEPGQFVGIGTD
ncbi:MAG: hypothetical protein WC455_28865 [Dehalococcoidia bacterium]|jgi:hypothetical protein